MIVVDSSALLAVLFEEPEKRVFQDIIDGITVSTQLPLIKSFHNSEKRTEGVPAVPRNELFHRQDIEPSYDRQKISWIARRDEKAFRGYAQPIAVSHDCRDQQSTRIRVPKAHCPVV